VRESRRFQTDSNRSNAGFSCSYEENRRRRKINDYDAKRNGVGEGGGAGYYSRPHNRVDKIARLFLQSELGPPQPQARVSLSPPSLVPGGWDPRVRERVWGLSQFRRGNRRSGSLGTVYMHSLWPPLLFGRIFNGDT
jgi:hypothetical protein